MGTNLKQQLDCYDVLCLWTFLAISYGELNSLAFCQGFKAVALNSAEVSKHVRT